MNRQVMLYKSDAQAEFAAIVDAIAAVLTDAEMNDPDLQVGERRLSEVAFQASVSRRDAGLVFQYFELFSAKPFGISRSQAFLIDVVAFGTPLATVAALAYLATLLL